MTRDYPGTRFTVRRSTEHSYEVLEVALAPTDRSPAERTKVICTYSALEPAEAHGWTLYEQATGIKAR